MNHSVNRAASSASAVTTSPFPDLGRAGNAARNSEPLEARRPLAFYRPVHATPASEGDSPRLSIAPDPRPPSFRRLALALEPGQIVDHAHRLTAALTRTREVAVDLVCVVDGFREIFSTNNQTLLADPEGYIERASQGLQSLALRVRSHGVVCTTQVLVGAPAIELGHHLDRTGADLLMLGRQMHGVGPWLRAQRWRPLAIRI
jgi:hypothetical protein